MQWSSGPQSVASLHWRAPVVGHSLAVGSTMMGVDPPHATTTRMAPHAIASLGKFIETKSNRTRVARTAGLYDAPARAVTPADPYDDDDDQPTLQRPAPASGAAPRQSGPPLRFASGFRAAMAPPASFEDSMEEELPSDLLEDLPIFPPEEDTAVDRLPLAPLPSDDKLAATQEASPALTMALPEPSPADAEMDTVTLPVEVVADLQRASHRDDE